MKLSVEAKVAASVAAGFVALTVGVIAQGGPTNNPEVSTHVSQPGYDSSLAGRAKAKENKYRTQWHLRE
jgi:hypothetical protein